MMQTEALAAFEKKFRQKELHVAEIGSWVLSVRPAQLTLGAMVLASRSGALAMSDLKPEEIQDMGRGFGMAERLAGKAFGAQRINYLCLMMQDPIVHFHVLPRYAYPLVRYGVDWVDADWPGPPVMRPAATPDPVLLDIRNALRSAL